MENLKKLRGKMGISQEELAKEVGLSRVSINYFECGVRKTASPQNLKKICDFFNVTPCELYGVDNLRYVPETREDWQKFINILTEEMNKRCPL